MEHRMTLAELIRSTTAVGEEYRRQARAAVQSGRLDRDEADRQLGAWSRSLEKARLQLERTTVEGGGADTWWHDANVNVVAFDSATTLDTHYVNNDQCTCRAFDHGHACWHRAAARIVLDWHERTTATRRPVSPRPKHSMAELQAAADELYA